MKIFRLLTMLLLGIMLNVNLTSCSKEDNLPEKGNNTLEKEDNTVEHPYGIPSNIPNNIIYYITSDDIIVRFENEDVFGGAKIVSNTYSTTKGYGTIEFASEVTAIERDAFKGKSYLKYVTLPNSATSIGTGAFADCSGLTSVTIPNSVKSIGSGAFYGCSGLTSVTISDIAAWCNIDFKGYESNPLHYAHHLYLNGNEVKNLVIPNSVKSIGNYAFYKCSGLKSVTIGNNVKSIGKEAFRDCSGLKSVTIPNSVKSIEDGAFYGCSALPSLTIGNSVESIGNKAFEDCRNLTSIIVPNSVKSIGNEAFSYCNGLSSITIGSGVKIIGDYAYSYCSNLKDVYCYAESVPTTASNAFYGTMIYDGILYVPASSIDSYRAVKPWGTFRKIVAITKN